MAILSVAILFGQTAVTRSAELVMFEQAFCEWCQNWKEEVGIIYSNTSEGKKVPVRMIDIHDKRPSDLNRLKPVVFTPTFVLVDKGEEIGRILGYTSEDHFWGSLKQMLERLPEGG